MRPPPISVEIEMEIPYEDTFIPIEVYAMIDLCLCKCSTDRGLQTWWEWGEPYYIQYTFPANKEIEEYCRVWVEKNNYEVYDKLIEEANK